jgi:hypothetical protein
MTDRHYDSGYRAPDGHLEVKFARQDDLVFTAFYGMLKDEDAEFVIRLFRDLLANIGKPYRHVMDITHFEGDTAVSRKKMADFALGPDSPYVMYSVVGGNSVMRLMFNLYARVSKVPMKMFSTEEQALAWMNGR